MDIKSMYLAEIEQWMKEHGQPAFRAKQVFQWMHQKYVESSEGTACTDGRGRIRAH